MESKEIEWAKFDVKEQGDRLMLELGKKYELGFNSIRSDVIEIVDEERTTEGKLEVKKPLNVIILGVDMLGGKLAKKELMITSKRFIQTIKTYFEKNMLFSRVFQLEKSGTGFQTTYQLIALQEKPAQTKAQDVEAFL